MAALVGLASDRRLASVALPPAVMSTSAVVMAARRIAALLNMAVSVVYHSSALLESAETTAEEQAALPAQIRGRAVVGVALALHPALVVGAPPVAIVARLYLRRPQHILMPWVQAVPAEHWGLAVPAGAAVPPASSS